MQERKDWIPWKFGLSVQSFVGIWSLDFFNAMGNVLCSYVEAHLELGVYCVAHILVNLDL